MTLDGHTPVVTGIGLACPLGADRESSWRALIDGRSAVLPGGAKTPISTLPEPRTITLAFHAADEAWHDARITNTDPTRLGCVVSSSKPVLGAGNEWTCFSPDIIPTAIARRFGAEGAVLNIASACATGAQSLLMAAGWIEERRADVVLAGAAESALHPLYLAGFQKLGVLSKKGVVRPFDRARDGFVVGEGAAVFVVESLAHALARGAKIYGNVLGGNFSSDAHHATRFNSNGRTMATCLQKALTQSGLTAGDLEYVNAHGTATVLNDGLETQALASLISAERTPVSSTKGATGHLLGATGAVEIAFCLLAMRDGILPPTLNLENPETDKLDFVPHHARTARVRHVASLSFGFGGSLAAVVLGNPS